MKTPEREDRRVPGPPTGSVTFLFTDIEGSTALLQHLGDQRFAGVLDEHRHILRAAFEAGGGYEVDTQGDSFLVAFGSAQDAVATVVAAQQAINAHLWPKDAPIRVRMGLHTGEPTVAGSRYVGIDVHRAARIMAVGYGGQILLSRTTHDLIGDALPEGLKVRDLGEHRLKDLTRPEHIFQMVIPDLPADFPPLKTLDIISNNLPIQLTSFIGREREIEHVKRSLAKTRLLTLMGAGGSGKTRLAVQVAADLIDQFEKGVWLVELAPLADPALVVQAVATTFQVREAAGRSLLDLLVDYLQTKSLLLMLDNCEHLVAACAKLASALLRACPNVKILATSREALGVAGEVAYHVPPLSRPDPRRTQTLEQLRQFEAVQLFVERGVHSQPRFALTDGNAAAVAHICHRLDGIPLAIELAAARVKVLTADQIATRLNDRFRLLTGGSRAGLPHHQTLRATIDWSHDLLSDKERTLLRRLSVFAGGFNLEAGEAICAGDGLEKDAILDLLTNLVDKSLVVAEGLNGDIRYLLLETVRQYGLEKLEEAGEVAGIREQHLEWYLGLAERVEPELLGPDQLGGLDELEREHDNLRAALEWAASGARDAEARVRLAGALQRFWSMRGHLTEGRAWLESAIEESVESGDASPAPVKAIYGAGVLAFYQGDYVRAVALLEHSLALSREGGDKVSTARALNRLALVHRNRGDYSRAITLLEESQVLCRATGQKWVLAQALHTLALAVRGLGDYDRATALLEESLPLWRETGDKSGLARSLASLGVVARLQRDFARARALHEQSLALNRELGHKYEIADALLNLGSVAKNEGDYARARDLYDECLILSREIGYRLVVAAALVNLAIVSHYQGDDERAGQLAEEAKTLLLALGAKHQIAVCLWALGNVAFARGDGDRAITLYRESLTLNRALGDKGGIAECLEALASVMAAAKQADQAVRLLGAAEALREAIKAPVPHEDRPAYERSVAAIQDILPQERFSAGWAQGKKRPLEDTVNEALGVSSQRCE
jgi:predicted ATPase/class 3 adenylate cyclase